MNLYINGQPVAPALGSVTLQKSRSEAAATLTAVLYTAPADTYFLRLSLAVGDVVRLLNDDGAEVFLGAIHEVERTPHAVLLTAYDPGVYLARNELCGIFCGSGADIVRAVAKKLAVAVGTVEADTKQHTIVSYAGQTAFSLLQQAAGEDREIVLSDGVLSVIKQTAARHAVTADQVLQVAARASLLRMVNKSIITDYRGRTLAEAERTADLAAYGQFQAIRLTDGSGPAAQAQAALADRFLSADVTLLGNLGYRCSDAVVFSCGGLGLDGAYLITAVSHRWEKGLFTTELTLEGTDT